MYMRSVFGIHKSLKPFFFSATTILFLVFVKAHALQKLKIMRYTKLVSSLTACSLFLKLFSSKYPKSTSL